MQVSPSPDAVRHSPFKGFIPFFWLALACTGGIFLAEALSLPDWIWAACFLLSLSCWLLTLFLPRSLTLTHYLIQWTRSEQRLPGIILAMVFFLGGWRYTTAKFEVTPKHAAYYNDRGTVQLIGTVVKPPVPGDSHTNLTVEVEALLPIFDSRPPTMLENISGRVLIQVPTDDVWAYGDRGAFTGRLETPFEAADFSYRDYLARQGVLSVMPYTRVDWLASGQGNPFKTALFSLQANALKKLHAFFPSPEADLLAGILLGRDEGLSPELHSAFRKTGTTHIIAISGFNIVILAGLFSGIFTRLLGHKWGAVAAICAISTYTTFVGGDPAVVRAAIMGSVGVLGGVFGRRQNGLNSLGLAAMGMMLINPNIPWDLGFQLSIAATLGLVLYGQPLEEWFIKIASRWLSKERAQILVGPLSEFLLFTLAAQVMTLPLIAYHFGGVSWLALFANPLILPVQSLVMILGGLALLSGLILPGLGELVALAALPFVRYTIRMVRWLGNFPFGEWSLPKFDLLWLGGFYFLLFYLTLIPREQRKSVHKKALSHQVALLSLLGLVLFTWNLALNPPDGTLHLTFLDPEGTVLMQTPAGHAILVGGGESPSRLNEIIGEALRGTDRGLDLVVVGSAARGDLNGLSGLLSAISVKQVLWGVDPEANQTCKTVYAHLLAQGMPITPMRTGQSLDLGDAITLEVLWRGDRGAVLWLEWKNFSALLPTGKVEDHWLQVPGAPDVLLLKDGLKGDELPIRQIDAWSPAVIILPLKESDLPLRGEHPLTLRLAGYPALSLLDDPLIQITTDGEQVWVYGK